MQVEGVELFAQGWGAPDKRPAILLLHDSLGSVELWRDFPARLAEATGRRVVAYDRWGFGRSAERVGRLPADFIHDEGARWVPGVCDAMGVERCVLFGHSVGGGMAVAAAAAMGPERCVGVVTVAAQCFVEERTREGIRAAQVEFARRPEQFAKLERYHGAKARWVLEAWTETWLSEAFAAWRLDEELRRVECPLLAMHGERDEYGSLEHPRRIARLVRGPSRVVELEGIGHVPQREAPERVIAETAAFLL